MLKVSRSDIRTPFNYILTVFSVQPAHIAFVLLNEGTGDAAAQNSNPGASLFSSVIQKAGGDPVSIFDRDLEI